MSVPESLFPLSGFYQLRPLQTDSLIRLVFAGVSACIVMSTQRILSASTGTNRFIKLGSCLRVSVPASLCPLSGFYQLRPLQTDSLIRLVFAGVSACIVMSSQRILSASPGTNRFKFRVVFAGVSACIAMSTQRILSASPVTNRLIN